jgi:hypothetical protein
VEGPLTMLADVYTVLPGHHLSLPGMERVESIPILARLGSSEAVAASRVRQ